MTRTWHGVTEVFDSPTTIRQKLEESFSEKLASTEFQIGYIEKRCNAKRWIEEPADCKSMYDSYRKGDTITLWCICVKDDDGDAQSASGRKPKKLTRHPPSVISMRVRWTKCSMNCVLSMLMTILALSTGSGVA